MRRIVALALCVAGSAMLATVGIGQARTAGRRPARICHRSHHRRVCRPPRRGKPHHGGTVTTTTPLPTSPAGGGGGGGGTGTVTTTTTSTSSTQTSSTQTTATSSTTAAPAHGTEIDERATGLQSPFYALNANAHTFAAGSIHFNVYNYDQDPHTFAVQDESGQQYTSAIAVPAGHPGTAVSVSVTLPPGTYVLYCTLPQHAADGMQTTVVVK